MFLRKLCFAVVLAALGTAFAEDSVSAPQNLRLERATYHKITISWEYPEDETQIADFRIYRDGDEIARSVERKFVDTDVTPGNCYEYRIDAVTVGGNASDQSQPLKVKAFESVEFPQHVQVEGIVDSLHDISVENLTAFSLLAAVKAGFESLSGGSLTLNTFDTELISQMIADELELIGVAVPVLTDAERLAAQAELDACLQEGFGGHSIEQVYIQEKLTTLAEKHWAGGYIVSAINLACI